MLRCFVVAGNVGSGGLGGSSGLLDVVTLEQFHAAVSLPDTER